MTQPNPRIRYNGEYAIDQIVLDDQVWTPDELRQEIAERALERARAALEAVIYFWERDPDAFGDDASITTLAGKFAAVANECRAALASAGRGKG